MDISALTQISKTGAPAQNSAGAAGGHGVFSPLAGLNFFDLIFTKSINPAQKKDGNGNDVLNGTITTEATNPLLGMLTPQASTGDSTLNVPAAMTLDAISQESIDALPIETVKRVQALLDMLTQGLPKGQKPILVIAAQSRNAAGALDTLSADTGLAPEELIATGLTPQDLAELAELAQQGDDAPTILIGIVQILPDDSGKEAVFIPRSIIGLKDLFLNPKKDKGGTEENADIVLDGDAPTEEDAIAAMLNALVVGSDETTQPKVMPDSSQATHNSPDYMARRSDVNAFLKMLEQAQNGRNNDPATGLKNNIGIDEVANMGTKTPASAGPANSTVPASGFKALLSAPAGDFTLGNIFPEGMDWAGQKWDGTVPATTITTAAAATTLITHAKSAGQVHPATQAIIATLTRNAQSGETRAMTLQLDPPELGRVEIQMHFTKDKNVKAHMIFEKPETMMMLQRDAQTLERALQEIGLDAGGSDLSFELASQDHSFDGDRNGNGQSASHGGAVTDEQETIIETTMNWYVDTETGLQRYNIMA